jgi:hypothetical protein
MNRNDAAALVATLSEDSGLTVYWALHDKFQWTGTPTTMGDITVEDDDEDFLDTTALTPAMRDAIAWSYTWRKGIPERTAEIANDLTPIVTVHRDGSFTVTECDGEATRYTAEGEKADL